MSDDNGILAVLENWEFVKGLPVDVKGFGLSVGVKKVNDEIDIFSYECAQKRKKVRGYYNCATKDYMLKRIFGLNDCCEMEYITPDIKEFERLLADGLVGFVVSMAEFTRESVSSILADKGLFDWEYGKELPESLCDFELYVRPYEPIGLISGLVVVIDYSDFADGSQFVIYYNMLRDEFYAEKKVKGVIYTVAGFEAKDLKGLAVVLAERLEDCLQGLRSNERKIK